MWNEPFTARGHMSMCVKMSVLKVWVSPFWAKFTRRRAPWYLLSALPFSMFGGALLTMRGFTVFVPDCILDDQLDGRVPS